MRNRWIRRRLLFLIFTFFIILYVDFQLRTSSLPKVIVCYQVSPAIHHRITQQAAFLVKDAQNPAKSTISSGEIALADGGRSVPEDAHVSQPELKVEDIYIAVKTTGRFHKTRLALLLETWISRTKAHTFIFTDTEDVDLTSEGGFVMWTMITMSTQKLSSPCCQPSPRKVTSTWASRAWTSPSLLMNCWRATQRGRCGSGLQQVEQASAWAEDWQRRWLRGPVAPSSWEPQLRSVFLMTAPWALLWRSDWESPWSTVLYSTHTWKTCCSSAREAYHSRWHWAMGYSRIRWTASR